MFGTNYYQDDDPMALYQHLLQRDGIRDAPKRFDEYYRCYPVVMFRGPDREDLEYGGKILMPPSALEKLTRLHITYPMLFELINGQKERITHCGVLEFTAEEGKLYLPHWVSSSLQLQLSYTNLRLKMMQTLLLETGDLVQIKSTDLPSASLVKLQPQSTNFLDISDPKAVLEKAFRNFATLTQGDVFSFKYNDTIYSVEALEVKPETEKMGVSMLETDVSVDFAPPVGYIEPQSKKTSGMPTVSSLSAGGAIHHEGTMAQAINYSSIAPSLSSFQRSREVVSPNFHKGGQKLNGKKINKSSTFNMPDKIPGALPINFEKTSHNLNHPQPLRLPPNKLFLGFEIKPLKTQSDNENDIGESKQALFKGEGNTLRGRKRK